MTGIRGYFKGLPVICYATPGDFEAKGLTSVRIRFEVGKLELLPALESAGVLVSEYFKLKDRAMVQGAWRDFDDLLAVTVADENLRNFFEGLTKERHS